MKRLLLSLLLVLATALPGVALAQGGSVILKINVVNPSQTEAQTVPLKVHLPKEASPKDIIDVGDLQVDYDADAGMYFVHSEVTLEPGESVTKLVHMNDIWVFTEEQLGGFVSQAKESASKLENTPHAEKAAALVLGVEKKVQEILKKQRETEANPGEHIRAYRQGMTLITNIEQDVTTLERLKQEGPGADGQRKSPPGKESLLDSKDSDSRIPLLTGPDGSQEGRAPLGRSLSMTTAWRIIFGVLAFLAVLSAISFVTWHRVLRVHMQTEQRAGPLSIAEKG